LGCGEKKGKEIGVVGKRMVGVRWKRWEMGGGEFMDGVWV